MRVPRPAPKVTTHFTEREIAHWERAIARASAAIAKGRRSGWTAPWRIEIAVKVAEHMTAELRCRGLVR